MHNALGIKVTEAPSSISIRFDRCVCDRFHLYTVASSFSTVRVEGVPSDSQGPIRS